VSRYADLGDVAFRYAGNGWYVFPLLPRSKTPATEHGFHDATCDVEIVRRWWETSPHANIGIDCGRSRLLVVDLDGEEGQRTWMTHIARQRRYVVASMAQTASGWHLYFTGSGPTTTGRLGRKIDTRGEGGYVVAPPSVHPSGHTYRWHHPGLLPPPSPPEWLLEALSLPQLTAAVGERRLLPPGIRVTGYGRVALEGLADELLAAVEGKGTRRCTVYRGERADSRQPGRSRRQSQRSFCSRRRLR
jgi:hypothetical protein